MLELAWTLRIMSDTSPKIVYRFILLVAAFASLATAIMSRTPKSLSDFDQLIYLTIAYDVDRYGVFSNGIFNRSGSTPPAPKPGMFVVPGYPALVLAAMKLDSRFAKAAACSIEANRNHNEPTECERYAAPIHILHAFLLALAVLAIAQAGAVIFGNAGVFWTAGVLAIGSLSAEANLFSFVMTESLTVSLYSVFALFAVLAWKTSRIRYFALAGIFLGLLCLTRPSFVVLIPVTLVLVVLNSRRYVHQKSTFFWIQALVFATACFIVLGPWIVRNHFSVGKWGLTEEYGSAVLIERFAFNDMSAREMMLAFPYCTPGIGDLAFDQVYGKDSMHRFVYHTRDSFFHVGRGRRDALVKEFGRLDPLIGGIVIDEMRSDWWRHFLVSIPLGWCGMWAGWLWALLLVPLFALACVRAARKRRPLLLLYAAPAAVMLCFHAVAANQSTRYNLLLIGPFSVGSAWIIWESLRNARWRSQSLAPKR
jgi:4-amino-4-deoxy-L-arabinose transferase-like glycosyltransferase